MRWIPAVLFALTLSSAGRLQAQGAASQAPDMAATKRWLEGDGKALMTATESKLNRQDVVLTVTEHEAVDVKLDQCQLSVVSRWHSELKSSQKAEVIDRRVHQVIPMKSVDRGGFKVVDFDAMSDRPVQIVSVRMRASEGAAVRSWTEGEENDVSRDEGASIYVRGRPEGERIIAALSRAAQLCGAPPAPF